MAKKLILKGGDNNDVVAASEPVVDPVDTKNEKPKFKVVKNLLLPLIAAVFIYSLVFFGLSCWGKVPFIWSIFLGFGLGMMCFLYIDYGIPGAPEYSKPIMLVMLTILIVSLSIHYLPGSGASNNADELTSESGTISEVDQFWATAKNFKQGDAIGIKISGGSVKLNKSNQLLKPGVYTLPILSDGNLIFRGVSNASIKIEVKE